MSTAHCLPHFLVGTRARSSYRMQNVQLALDYLRYKKIKLVSMRGEDIMDRNPNFTLEMIWMIILYFQPHGQSHMRFYMLQNEQLAPDFHRYKKIKLVSIRGEDIMDGNPNLTLGIIWIIILHFQPCKRCRMQLIPNAAKSSDQIQFNVRAEHIVDTHTLALMFTIILHFQPHEPSCMRFHMLQNIQMVLNVLRYKKIKLVNTDEDIVDGNLKLKLRLILHFQGKGFDFLGVIGNKQEVIHLMESRTAYGQLQYQGHH